MKVSVYNKDKKRYVYPEDTYVEISDDGCIIIYDARDSQDDVCVKFIKCQSDFVTEVGK